MNKNILKGLALAAAAVMGATVVWAVPPPVPQSNGFKDTSFDQFQNTDCMSNDCHIKKTASGYQTLTEAHDTLISRHHALIWNNKYNIPQVSCVNLTGAKPTTLVAGCHTTSPGATRADGTTENVISDVKNCKGCHTSGSPHHSTTWALAQDCKHCHGLIDNPLDGHYINSTTKIDTGKGGITPGPVGRSVPDPNDPTHTKTIIVQGCEACHQESLTNTAFPIRSNVANHHNTGLYDLNKCNFCHSTTAPTGSTNIRACEACHGIQSLHAIQWDTTNPASPGGIVVGKEDAGFGHVGNNWDCVGCHSGWGGLDASSMLTNATLPAVTDLSITKLAAGQAANLTINGAGFSNVGSSGETFNPVVTITGIDVLKKLTPFSFTQSEIQVALPTDLPVGVYEVRVEKSGVQSNLSTLVVVPAAPALTSAVGSGTSLTIAGKGFGLKPPAEGNGVMGVFVDGVAAPKVISWSENRVVVTTKAPVKAGQTVVVKGLYGSGSTAAAVASKKAR